jgi:hypothetical protein
MNFVELWTNCVKQSFESLKKHIESRGDGKVEDFEEEVGTSGLDLDEGVDSEEVAESQIAAIGKLAAPHTETIDIDSMVRAFKSVCSWVQQDVRGRHTVQPEARDRRNWASSTPVAGPSSEPIAAPAIVAAPIPLGSQQVIVPSAVQIGGDDDSDYNMANCPEIYLFWCISDKGEREKLQEITGTKNMHAAYRVATESEEYYWTVVEKMKDTCPPEDCPEDVVSPFPVVRFGENSDESEEDWGGVED